MDATAILQPVFVMGLLSFAIFSLSWLALAVMILREAGALFL